MGRNMIKPKYICIVLLIFLIIDLLPNQNEKVFAEGAEISQTVTSQPMLNKWKKIHTISDICLGILDDDSLWQWRTNIDSSPIKVLDKVDEVSIGDKGNILAITKDKKLWSWCLGNHIDSAVYNCTSEPKMIMDNVINISAGSHHTCLFVRVDGSLWACIRCCIHIIFNLCHSTR